LIHFKKQQPSKKKDMTKFRKTYKTRCNEAIIPFKLGDVTVTATFKNGNIRDNEWAKLETSDPVVQLVIEQSPLYGKAVLLDSMIEIVEEKPEPELTADDVTTLEQAREYLVKNFGMDKRTISAPNALKSAAKGHGVEFPNLK
jgi:hypothetical protein